LAVACLAFATYTLAMNRAAPNELRRHPPVVALDLTCKTGATALGWTARKISRPMRVTYMPGRQSAPWLITLWSRSAPPKGGTLRILQWLHY